MNATRFPEFDGRHLTWDAFYKEVEDRELVKYSASIQVVTTFREKTLEAMDIFKREVMDKNYSADEADIILSTCHAAKGMEWDNVHLCEGFLDIAKVKAEDTENKTWQFDMKKYGDEINLLYVACTRAKKLLCVPAPIQKLLQDFDAVHDMICASRLYEKRGLEIQTELVVLGRKEVLSVDDALGLYESLVFPLRQSFNLLEQERLTNVLFGDAEEEDVKMPKNDTDFASYHAKLKTKLEETPSSKSPRAKRTTKKRNQTSRAAKPPKRAKGEKKTAYGYKGTPPISTFFTKKEG